MQNLYRVYRALEYKLHPALVFIDAHILDKRTRLNNSGGSGGIQKRSKLFVNLIDSWIKLVWKTVLM
jgi:hypothetical protein